MSSLPSSVTGSPCLPNAEGDARSLPLGLSTGGFVTAANEVAAEASIPEHLRQLNPEKAPFDVHACTSEPVATLLPALGPGSVAPPLFPTTVTTSAVQADMPPPGQLQRDGHLGFPYNPYTGNAGASAVPMPHTLPYGVPAHLGPATDLTPSGVYHLPLAAALSHPMPSAPTFHRPLPSAFPPQYNQFPAHGHHTPLQLQAYAPQLPFQSYALMPHPQSDMQANSHMSRGSIAPQHLASEMSHRSSSYVQVAQGVQLPVGLYHWLRDQVVARYAGVGDPTLDGIGIGMEIGASSRGEGEVVVMRLSDNYRVRCMLTSAAPEFPMPDYCMCQAEGVCVRDDAVQAMAILLRIMGIYMGAAARGPGPPPHFPLQYPYAMPPCMTGGGEPYLNATSSFYQGALPPRAGAPSRRSESFGSDSTSTAHPPGGPAHARDVRSLSFSSRSAPTSQYPGDPGTGRTYSTVSAVDGSPHPQSAAFPTSARGVGSVSQPGDTRVYITLPAPLSVGSSSFGSPIPFASPSFNLRDRGRLGRGDSSLPPGGATSSSSCTGDGSGGGSSSSGGGSGSGDSVFNAWSDFRGPWSEDPTIVHDHFKGNLDWVLGDWEGSPPPNPHWCTLICQLFDGQRGNKVVDANATVVAQKLNAWLTPLLGSDYTGTTLKLLALTLAKTYYVDRRSDLNKLMTDKHPEAAGDFHSTDNRKLRPHQRFLAVYMLMEVLPLLFSVIHVWLPLPFRPNINVIVCKVLFAVVLSLASFQSGLKKNLHLEVQVRGVGTSPLVLSGKSLDLAEMLHSLGRNPMAFTLVAMPSGRDCWPPTALHASSASGSASASGSRLSPGTGASRKQHEIHIADSVHGSPPGAHAPAPPLGSGARTGSGVASGFKRRVERGDSSGMADHRHPSSKRLRIEVGDGSLGETVSRGGLVGGASAYEDDDGDGDGDGEAEEEAEGREDESEDDDVLSEHSDSDPSYIAADR